MTGRGLNQSNRKKTSSGSMYSGFSSALNGAHGDMVRSLRYND